MGNACSDIFRKKRADNSAFDEQQSPLGVLAQINSLKMLIAVQISLSSLSSPLQTAGINLPKGLFTPQPYTNLLPFECVKKKL